MSMVPEPSAGSNYDFWKMLLIVAFAMNTFILLVVAWCVKFIIRVMVISVECYCTQVIRAGSMSTAAPRWSIVWATFRKASETVAHAMCVLEWTIFLILACAFLDVCVVLSGSFASDNVLIRINLVVPGGVWMLGICKVFYRAAQVSDMCNRLPSLLNSCVEYRAQSSVKQLAIVQYVRNSAAGFYL